MEPTTTWDAHERYVLGLAYGPDDKVLYSCGMEGDIVRWRLDEGAPALDLRWRAHDKSCNSLALSVDGGTLVSGSTDQTVKVWDAATSELRLTLTDRKQTVAKVLLSPKETNIAAAWYGGRITVWDRSGALVAGIKASKKNQVALAIAPDEGVAISGGLGDDLAVWSLPDGVRLATLSGHETAVSSAAFLPDGRLLSLGYEGTMRLWEGDREDWRNVATWRPEAQGLRGMLVDAEHGRVALAAEGVVLILCLAGAERARIALPVKAVGAMAFSHDGRTLAIGTADNKIRVYHLT